ncbi:MAG: phage holin family protein [Spirosomataceae bacterium]
MKEKVTNYLGLDQLRENIIALIEAKIALTKIEFQEKLEEIIAQAIFALVKISILLTVLLLLSVLLGSLLNYWLDSRWLGYLVLIGIYLAALGLIHWQEKKIVPNIRKGVQLLLDKTLTNQKNEK